MLRHKDELMCDFADSYNIYNIKALPVETLAGLACGLGLDSRTVMKMEGRKLPINTLLLAGILDALNLGNWMQSKDGSKGRNRPASILPELLGETKEKQNNIVTFSSAEEFEAARRSLIGE